MAERSLTAGRRALARQWARTSIQAWARYGMAREKYYFPHYCLALSLAVAGKRARAARALEMAAKLSKNAVSDWNSRMS